MSTLINTAIKYNILILLLLTLIVWSFLSYIIQIPFYYLPTPESVLKIFINRYDVLLFHSSVTFFETVTGFILSIIFGYFSAIFLCWFANFRLFVIPFFIVSQVVPSIILAPFINLWFGLGMEAKIIIAIISNYFVVAIAFMTGLINTPEEYINMAKLMGGSKLTIMRYIRIPYALPTLATGLRIAAPYATVGALAGEWAGASKGLGYIIIVSNSRMATDMMFASLIMLILMSLILYYIVDKALNILIPSYKSPTMK